MIYVIGSGPAGVSAAVALVNKGHEVTMLDAGFDLEPEQARLVDRLRQQDKKNWDRESVSALKAKMITSLEGVDLKYVYGSDYPYRGMNRHQPVKLIGANMIRSLAKGGLSTVWGASILPYREGDIEGWPITIKDLEPHYRAVLSFMPHSGKKDGLGAILPLYDDFYQQCMQCRQASAFLYDLEVNRNALEAEKIFFGFSRLAVKFDQNQDGPGCPSCGMCLYGCPYGNIYSAAFTLDQLMGHKKFNYKNNVLVEKLIETNGEVKILAKSLFDSGKLEFNGSLVFLAAGILSSTRILLQSMEAFHHPLVIKHSEHFQFPLLRYKKTRNVAAEDLHTLTQLSILILDKSVSKNTVHMQVYAYNDLYIKAINQLIGPLAPVLKRPVEEIIGRLLFIKGYLHSDISSRILVSLEPGKDGRLLLEGRSNNESKKAVNKIVAKLFRNRKYFRAVPVLAKISEPGKGNHSGGSFPMKKKPSEFETDELGRPYGFKRVHVVDSSVFPTVPATTITLTIMANAHRIASDC